MALGGGGPSGSGTFHPLTCLPCFPLTSEPRTDTSNTSGLRLLTLPLSPDLAPLLPGSERLPGCGRSS